MNPAWLPAISAVLGLLLNGGWALFNAGQRASIRESRASMVAEIAALKEWIAKEYVPRELCKLQQGQHYEAGAGGAV